VTQSLAHQRCFNHVQREAVAKCPVCSQFYCRECITEHDDRVICAACLAKISQAPLRSQRTLASLRRLAVGLLGLIVVWFFFYLIGQALLAIPSSFHEGTMWQSYSGEST
jgi:hypothetical protein